MYLRIEGLRRNDTSSSRLGIFQLAFELRDKGTLPSYAQEELERHLKWLKEHLKSPKVLREEGHHRAIAWFHPRAKKPIAHIRAMKAILEEEGYFIEQVETQDPGVIIYEDGWQTIAKPRKRRAT